MTGLNKNYSRNYIKIYLWRTISLVSGFLSLLIVVPHLSNNQELYGVYAFCISFTLYLTYADIGFLSAGQKYAAEEFAKGNRKEEIGILGFTGAILLLMILPFSFAMVYFSFYPNKILNDLTSEGQEIASSVFLILGVLTPFQIILQRLAQSILIIRIKDFISLRIDVVFNLIKIFSIYFFFSAGKYMVVEYFLFITIMTILGSLVVIFVIRRAENYNFIELIKSIKLSRKYFHLTKKLAYSSLFLTLGWLIYYELDLIIIGKWFGPHEVAIYAIGFTFLNFLRSLWNIVFSPYSQRFNHFSGTNSMIEMKKMARNIMNYTLPLCIVVTTILVLSAKQIVLFWVGPEYLDSVLILQILIIGTAFGFVANPANYYFIAKTRYRYIYTIAIILPVVFLLGLIFIVPKMGVEGFAISKTIAMAVGFIISLIGISELIKPFKVISKWMVGLILFFTITLILQPKIYDYLFPLIEKNTYKLIEVVSVSMGLIIFSLFILFFSRKQYRIQIISTIKEKFNLIG
jgi:O-antigen/teichoic acid export membrane protein